MDFKVIWTDSAIADLKAVCDYIALDNPSAVERVGRGILEHVRILETFPMIGPVYPRRSSGMIREIVYRKYRIFMKSWTSRSAFTSSVSGTERGASRNCRDLN